LSKEVEYFKATKAKMVAAVGAAAVDALLKKSVFVVNMGNNDIYAFADSERERNRSAEDQRRDAAALYANLVSNYSASIKV
jgi:hypothetical protein